MLDSLDRTRPLLASTALKAQWDEPSGLALLSVAGLAGHLVRAATSVEGYLEADEPDAAAIGPDEYYLTLQLSSDPDDATNRGIRQRGLAAAAEGVEALLGTFEHSASRLRRRFDEEAPDRLVTVAGGLVLTLDAYLVTRLVELLVHADDLAQSIHVDTPAYSPEAHAVVRCCLVGVALGRSGELGVLRALTRRERDPEDALRVF